MQRLAATALIAGSFLCVAAVQAEGPSRAREIPRLGTVRFVEGPPPSVAGAFGGEVQQRLISVSEFMPAISDYAYLTNLGEDLHPLENGLQYWFAPLALPAGAILEEIRLLVRDEDAAEDIVGNLYFVTRDITGSAPCDGLWGYGQWERTTEGLSGSGIVVMTDDMPVLIQTQAAFPCANENYLQHFLSLELSSLDHAFTGAVVRWRRSVAPAPSAATFGDVPTNHPLFQFVEALAASGITAGCGSGNYCPNNPLTRGQMAVFLSIALGLHWPL